MTRPIEMTSQFRMGDNPDVRHILFVGACPGRFEGKDRRPFSNNGRAGRSLRILVRILHETRPEVFCSDLCDHYTLINSHPEVKNTGTPDRKKISDPENLRRFDALIRSCSSNPKFICLGEDAKYAVRKLFNQDKVILSLPHPTSRKVNKKKKGSWDANWRAWVGEWDERMDL